VVDNGSIYTKTLLDFLSETNVPHHDILFDQIKLSKLQNFSSIILSGRKVNNKLMNATNSKIIKHAVLEKKPLLGICYGAEILALTIGGTIKRLSTQNKGIEKIKVIKKNPLCDYNIEVFQSHSYAISKVTGSLISLAKSNSSEFEIIQYKDFNIFGTQFHPEMSDDGKSIIEAFVSLSS